MKQQPVLFLLLFSLLLLLPACKKLMPAAPEENDILDGPVEGLNHEQARQHLRGDVAFNDRVFTKETGLGSVFVANSCGSCHAGDGKGHPSTTLIRFGQPDTNGNLFLNQGGPQLQNLAIPGFKPEVIPPGASFSKFTPPANTGLGFLELVPDADLIAMCDPFDKDGDGISGVANWRTLSAYLAENKNSISRNGRYIHRFGKKAAAFSLLHQTVNAYNQDMGITSVYEPRDVYAMTETDAEISTQEVQDVVFYLQTLKAPLPRNTSDAMVLQGKNIFKALACDGCHKESLRTGPSPVAALSEKTFYPYTDLLLHDMGPGLDDGYTEGSALTSEWRTPALWGLGLSPKSQGGDFYLLHDGRARSIEQAILLHGGEATKSRSAYEALPDNSKSALLKFLNSL